MEEKRQIKKFIFFVIKVTLILTCAYFVYQGLFWYLWLYEGGPKAYEDAYQHALYKQYSQISSEARDNEIIFFGSSTCTFGIDVDTVKEVTGQNAQIFAIESAITPRYLMKELQKIAKPGDTICCVFDGGDYSREDFLTTCCAFEDNKEYLKSYFKVRNWDFETQKPTLVWRKLYALTAGGIVEKVRSSMSVKDQVYTFSSFDDNGNMLANKEDCFVSMDVNPSVTLSLEDIDEDLIVAFNEFNDWCIANNIRFVFAHNMHAEGSLYNDEASLVEYQNALETALDGEFVLTVEEATLPPDCFFNSYYHLNNKGAREYSSRIANNL